MNKTLYNLKKLSIIPSMTFIMASITVSSYADTKADAFIEESLSETVQESVSKADLNLNLTLTDSNNGLDDSTEQSVESIDDNIYSESSPSGNPVLETVATLTEEQVKEGYKLIDGKVYSPDELTEAQKDSGIHYGGVMPSTSTGLVAFYATLPNGIHDDVYVTVIDVNTYESYQTVLYEVNHFTSSIHLPDGNYILSKCGLTTDQEGRFFTESKRFTVNRGSYNVVNIDVLDNQAKVKDESQTSLENGDTSETVTGNIAKIDDSSKYINAIPDAIDWYSSVPLGERKKESMSIKNIIFLILSIGIPVGIVFKWIKGKQ